MMSDREDLKMTYAASGVNIDAAAAAKQRIRQLARTTFSKSVLSEIGSFGGLFRFDQKRYEDPVLVSSCDGVGTKLKIAFMTGIHNTVGYDLVSHCVSDILVQGARPLFFLDYIAAGQLEPGVVEQVVSGLARGCAEVKCALIGGETAEMPDFYTPGEYDLAGFIVGVVDRGKLIDGSKIVPGDKLLGLPSAGLHTNGYSLARRLFFDRLGLRPEDYVDELAASVAELLLRPHRSYFSLLEPLLDGSRLKGMAHITGGGITDNVPRILPSGTAALVAPGSWPRLPIFDYLQSKGHIADDEMYRTFNMGIGMILVVAPGDVSRIIKHCEARDERCYELGSVIEGDGKVRYSRSC